MALDFTYQPPPPLQIPGTPSSGSRGGGAGAMQALTAIMAQRMSKKVQAEQAQGIAQAQTDVVKLFGNQGAVERMPVRYIDFTRFKGMTRQEFKDNLMSSPEIQYGPEEAESAANIFFQQFDAKMYKPEIIAQGKTMLINSGMKGADADRIIDQITEGGYAGPGDMAEDLSKTALDHVKSIFYGRPTTSVNVDLGKEFGTEDPFPLIQRGVQEGITMTEQQSFRDLDKSIPDAVLRDWGIGAKSESISAGLRSGIALDESGRARVQFFSGLDQSDSRRVAQEELASSATDYINRDPIRQDEWFSLLSSGGKTKDKEAGNILQGLIEANPEAYRAIVPLTYATKQPRFLERNPTEDQRSRIQDIMSDD